MIQAKLKVLFNSKWFYYIFIGIVIAFFMLIIFPSLATYGIINADLQLNLFSECWGLLFTLFFFVTLFELREYLEWKPYKEAIMKRIGFQLQSIFRDICELCKVELEFDPEKDDFDFIKYQATKTDLLLKSQKFKLCDSWKNAEISAFYADRFYSSYQAIGNIESTHEKHLKPIIQQTLVNLKDSLRKLAFEFHAVDYNEENREHFINKYLVEALIELSILKQNKFEIKL